jgi:hypothetical protein
MFSVASLNSSGITRNKDWQEMHLSEFNEKQARSWN